MTFPAWLDLDAWAGFVEMRKRIKAPLTSRAITLTINELGRIKDQGYDPNAALDQSTQRGWRGVWAVQGQEPKRVLRDKHGNAYRVTADGFRQLIPESEVIQ